MDSTAQEIWLPQAINVSNNGDVIDDWAEIKLSVDDDDSAAFSPLSKKLNHFSRRGYDERYSIAHKWAWTLSDDGVSTKNASLLILLQLILKHTVQLPWS